MTIEKKVLIRRIWMSVAGVVLFAQNYVKLFSLGLVGGCHADRIAWV